MPQFKFRYKVAVLVVEVAELRHEIARNSERRNGATANPMDVYGRMRKP